jgi:hypothetical protein
MREIIEHNMVPVVVGMLKVCLLAAIIMLWIPAIVPYATDFLRNIVSVHSEVHVFFRIIDNYRLI